MEQNLNRQRTRTASERSGDTCRQGLSVTVAAAITTSFRSSSTKGFPELSL
jgi:hypothetical protein